MAKELPYFKFECNQWDAGNIQMCSMESQGLFINLCSLYWSRVGELPIKLAKQKVCKSYASAYEELIQEQIIVEENDNIVIEFLDEQLNEFADTSKKRRDAANKRWSNASALQEQSKSNAIREDETRKDKKKEDNTVTRALIEDKHREFSIKFYEELTNRGVINKSIKVNDNLIHHIRKLETVDKINWEDIKSGANYYFNNLSIDFMPEIQSTKAFRDKFDKLVAHKKRQP